MNEGVGILLERMKTHPEEFTEGYKWSTLMQEMHKYATKEESQALDTALRALMMEKLTARVMEELIDPKSETSPYTVKPSVMPSGGLTLGASTSSPSNLTWSNATSSLTIGNQTLDESTIEHMKLHAQYMKAQLEAEKQKLKSKQQRKATIFGRLFNYS